MPRPSNRRARRGARRGLALGAAAALLAVVAAPSGPAVAATPSSGTVSPAAPNLAYAGKVYQAGVSPGVTADATAGCPPAASDPTQSVCDYFTLTVAVPATTSNRVTVEITWPDAADDFDLFVFKGNTTVAAQSATGGSNKETAVLPNGTGAYEIRVAPFLVTNSGYQATVKYEAVDPNAGLVAAPGGPAAYNGQTLSATGIAGRTGPDKGNPDTEPQSTTAPYDGPPVLIKTTNVGRKAAEPTIGVDKLGRAFYAAATFDSAIGQARTEFKRSVDGNLTWQDVTPRVGGQTSMPQSLDPYVYVEEDSGRLYVQDLLVAGSEQSQSDDGGATYTTTVVTTPDGTVQDHQTIFAGPRPVKAPAASVAAVTPLTDARFQEIFYYCFNRVADSRCLRSFNGGLTYLGTETPAFTGVDPVYPGQLCGGLHGHIATANSGPFKGRLFLPKGHCGQPWLAYSDDAGDTWTRLKVSDTVTMLDNQSSVAADDAGNVYYVWYDGKHQLPYLAVSKNGGATFGPPIMIAPPGVREVNWPTVAVGEPGKIAIQFPGTTVAGEKVDGVDTDSNDLSRPWNTYAVTSVNALDSNPLFISNIANPSGDPIHRGDCNGRCGGMLDFLDMIVAPNSDGDFWGTAVDTCTASKNCSTVPGPGLSGETADGVADDMQGLAFKQISGPALRSGPNMDPPGNTGGGVNPVVPEVPLAVLLPVVALVAAGGALALAQHRRRRITA